MAENQGQPLLRPALRLMIEPVPDPVEGRGKGRTTTKLERLGEQQEHLVRRLQQLDRRRENLTLHGGKTLLIVRMFDDSLAQTHTPTDLFDVEAGCRFVAPRSDGYLVEVEVGKLQVLAKRVAQAPNWAVKADISRVETIRRFQQREVLRGRTLDQLWDRAMEDESGRYFLMWLRPYHDDEAREELLKSFQRLTQDRVIVPVLSAPQTEAPVEPQRGITSGARLRTTSITRAMGNYRRTPGVGRAVVKLASQSDLLRLVASGTVFRLDPVRPVRVTSGQPGVTAMQVPVLHDAPVVAVIDGGLHDPAYKAAEAWSMPPIVSAHEADQMHGNAISSLIVHGHELNSHLDLPALGARVGTAQAVPHRSSNTLMKPDDLLDMLQAMAVRHREARVWNMSLNLDELEDEPGQMSDLGHQLAGLARAAGVLPVVSIGNISGQNDVLLPPADCEAALTVGGRLATRKGGVGAHCPKCCQGPGPEGMLKPEVSWFSRLSVLGNQQMVGSSFATAMVSVLAAHTFDRLKSPTPDLVRALLINRSELDGHDPRLGWGTPYDGTPPWECAPGTVTMTWQAALLPGLEYHWDGIPIPAEMLDGGRMKGGATLTAVLEPLVSPFAGPNYFSTRVEVALQHMDANGKWQNLLGTMKESTLAEHDARNELKKWHPVRHVKKNKFNKGVGGGELRLRARLYTRDLFQPGLPNRTNMAPQNVAFVLTLKSPTAASTIYDSTVRNLGSFVESAVFEQDVTVVNDM